jgi:endogenous inhibitor of DNA gyrase (YacG/DUF329 family)
LIDLGEWFGESRRISEPLSEDSAESPPDEPPRTAH